MCRRPGNIATTMQAWLSIVAGVVAGTGIRSAVRAPVWVEGRLWGCDGGVVHR
jgi:hypothetical protein